jgi:hypothetical protein
MSRLVSVFFCLIGLAAPALADKTYTFPDDPDEADFIANEVLATFYHELGHGLIDVLQIPVLGKEEDAADTMSVILMNQGWEEKSASAILTSDAQVYAMRAADADADESDFADEHSLDIQRYYSVVCLFYGANPQDRKQLAIDLELPAEKLDSCPDEWDYASNAWAKVLQGAEPGPGKKGLVLAEGQEDLPLGALLADEITALNQDYGLPETITVLVADCGESNAYYSPDDKTITICNEYAEDVQALYEADGE